MVYLGDSQEKLQDRYEEIYTHLSFLKTGYSNSLVV